MWTIHPKLRNYSESVLFEANKSKNSSRTRIEGIEVLGANYWVVAVQFPPNKVEMQIKHFAGDAASASMTGGSAHPVPQPRASRTSWEGADSLQPTTTIQIRLADGSRMVSHTATQSTLFSCPFFLLEVFRIFPKKLCVASHLSPKIAAIAETSYPCLQCCVVSSPVLAMYNHMQEAMQM